MPPANDIVEGSCGAHRALSQSDSRVDARSPSSTGTRLVLSTGSRSVGGGGVDADREAPCPVPSSTCRAISANDIGSGPARFSTPLRGASVATRPTTAATSAAATGWINASGGVHLGVHDQGSHNEFGEFVELRGTHDRVRNSNPRSCSPAPLSRRYPPPCSLSTPTMDSRT